jgi:hypothetical protein
VSKTAVVSYQKRLFVPVAVVLEVIWMMRRGRRRIEGIENASSWSLLISYESNLL